MSRKSTALKVRLDVAFPMDLTDIGSVTQAAKASDELKKCAINIGFSLAEASAKTGTFEFAEVAKSSDE